MSTSSLALSIAVILSIIYSGMSVAAFLHVPKERRQELWGGMLALTLWWPFYDIYEPEAHRLRVLGKTLFVLIVLAYIAWGSTK